MSNTLLQNAGFDTFLNIEDLEDPCFEDDFFGEISSFTKDIWTNTRCNEMEEDDLPLTKYLLQFNTEEHWDSEEEISVEGESFEENTCTDQLGWDVAPGDLDTEIFDIVEDTPEKRDAPSKEEQVKDLKGTVEKSGLFRVTSNGDNLQEDINLSLFRDKSDSGKKQLKKNTVSKSVSKVDSFPNGRKSAKSQTQCKIAVKSVSNSTTEPQKSVTTTKSQAEKAKEQRERKKKYVQELQDNIEELKKDKADLQQVTAQLNNKLESLTDEIRYLKGVITNQSELARILKSVANTPAISLSCGVLRDCEEGNDGKTNKRKYADALIDSGKKGVDLRQGNGKKRKVDKTAADEMSTIDAGVCVHVQSGKVSLEFCAECSKKANSAIN